MHPAPVAKLKTNLIWNQTNFITVNFHVCWNEDRQQIETVAVYHLTSFQILVKFFESLPKISYLQKRGIARSDIGPRFITRVNGEPKYSDIALQVCLIESLTGCSQHWNNKMFLYSGAVIASK